MSILWKLFVVCVVFAMGCFIPAINYEVYGRENDGTEKSELSDGCKRSKYFWEWRNRLVVVSLAVGALALLTTV